METLAAPRMESEARVGKNTGRSQMSREDLPQGRQESMHRARIEALCKAGCTRKVADTRVTREGTRAYAPDEGRGASQCVASLAATLLELVTA